MVTGCSKKEVFLAVLKGLEPRTRLHYNQNPVYLLTLVTSNETWRGLGGEEKILVAAEENALPLRLSL